jgi:hypothetical protein
MPARAAFDRSVEDAIAEKYAAEIDALYER